MHLLRSSTALAGGFSDPLCFSRSYKITRTQIVRGGYRTEFQGNDTFTYLSCFLWCQLYPLFVVALSFLALLPSFPPQPTLSLRNLRLQTEQPRLFSRKVGPKIESTLPKGHTLTTPIFQEQNGNINKQQLKIFLYTTQLTSSSSSSSFQLGLRIFRTDVGGNPSATRLPRVSTSLTVVIFPAPILG